MRQFRMFCPNTGNWPMVTPRMGYQATRQYPLAARQGRHEYGSKHVAGVPLGIHAVGRRPNSGAYFQIRTSSTSPKYRATLTMARGYFQLF
ncbi:hypothetical protein PoB_001856400 [Plakobranchus ocellatus]|uniref:Uncharacterized protein n=1 Tax=Plakobranchus ocellatus TaxID=259542 RepID=A0AAV3ZCF5_9GAST|nr:hypothetical protein PoB_001856400 [Plakobranchus ocellatus]